MFRLRDLYPLVKHRCHGFFFRKKWSEHEDLNKTSKHSQVFEFWKFWCVAGWRQTLRLSQITWLTIINIPYGTSIYHNHSAIPTLYTIRKQFEWAHLLHCPSRTLHLKYATHHPCRPRYNANHYARPWVHGNSAGSRLIIEGRLHLPGNHPQQQKNHGSLQIMKLLLKSFQACVFKVDHLLIFFGHPWP